jgi:hypothetical protein
MAELELAIADAMTAVRLTVNDQAVKEYTRKTLGDRAAERKAWLAEVMRAVDERGQAAGRAASERPRREVGTTSGSATATSVTAPTKEDTAAGVDTDVGSALARPRRALARLAVAGAGLALGGVVIGVWVTRPAAKEPTAPLSTPLVAASTSAPPAPSPAPSPTPIEPVATASAAATAEPSEQVSTAEPLPSVTAAAASTAAHRVTPRRFDGGTPAPRRPLPTAVETASPAPPPPPKPTSTSPFHDP